MALTRLITLGLAAASALTTGVSAQDTPPVPPAPVTPPVAPPPVTPPIAPPAAPAGVVQPPGPGREFDPANPDPIATEIVTGGGQNPVVGPPTADNLPHTTHTTTVFHVYPDVEPATCTPGGNCTDGGMPIERGICVISATGGHACWDVCNSEHEPVAYAVDKTNAAVENTYTGLVSSIRAGRNPMVKCQNMASGDPCPLGEECPAAFLTEFSVPKGRGLCVIDGTHRESRACWDVCNTARSTSAFTMGTPVGTGAKVGSMRSSGICPGPAWWFVPVIVLGLLLLLACLGGVFVAVSKLGKGKMRSRKDAALVESRYNDESSSQDYKDYGGEPMREEMPAPSGMDYSMQQEPMPNYGDIEQPQQQQQQQMQMPETVLSPAAQEPLVNLYDTSSSRQMGLQQPQTMVPQNVFSPSGGGLGSPQGMSILSPKPMDQTVLPGGSMRIPGLSEPNLLNSIPGLQVPGSSSSLHQQNQFVLGTTQPAQVFSGQQPVGMPSFHTQVPSSYMAGASPPSSIQMPQGGMQSGGFFNTIQRR